MENLQEFFHLTELEYQDGEKISKFQNYKNLEQSKTGLSTANKAVLIFWRY